MKQKYIKGDIVMYDNKIHTIIDTLGLNNYELSYVRHTVNRAELSGFPLTTEILEKNGWKKDGKWHYLKTRRAYLYTIQDAGQPDEFLICADTDKHNLTSVSSVHQLQHLLFGLGLNSEMEV